MGLKTNTVRPMADSSFSDKILGSFWGRFFIVILQTVLISQLLLLSFLVRLYVNITLLKYIVVLIGWIASRVLNPPLLNYPYPNPSAVGRTDLHRFEPGLPAYPFGRFHRHKPVLSIK